MAARLNDEPATTRSTPRRRRTARWLSAALLAAVLGVGATVTGAEPPATKTPAPVVVTAPVVESPARQAGRAFVEWMNSRLPESLTRKSFLLENWRWLLLFLLVALGLLADRLVCYFVGRLLNRWKDHAKLDVPDKLSNGVRRPTGIAATALVWVGGLPYLALPRVLEDILAVAAGLVLTLGVVWAAYRLTDLLAAWLFTFAEKTETKLDDLLVPFLRKTLKVFVVLVGLMHVAENFAGVNPTNLLAGLGLGGLAFALAAKDTVANLFGSITILFDRPFQIGDWINIGGVDGTVEEVGFRSTRIRTFYNSLVSMPNSMLVNERIDNYGARIYRRIKTMLSLTYDTPPEKIEAFCEGLRELIRRHPHTRKDYFHVYFNEYAASSLNVLLYCFVKTPDWSTELAEKHRLFVDLKRLAKELGVEFAFPTQTLHVADGGFPAGAALAGLAVPAAPAAPTAPAAARTLPQPPAEVASPVPAEPPKKETTPPASAEEWDREAARQAGIAAAGKVTAYLEKEQKRHPA